MRTKQTGQKPSFPSLPIILKEFNAFLESIHIHNMASYLYLCEFRERFHALIRPCLIFYIACLAGIGYSLVTSLAGN